MTSYSVEFEKKNAKANQAFPGLERRYLQLMNMGGIHSATQGNNLHTITSSYYNGQDLKDASNFKASLWRMCSTKYSIIIIVRN